MKKVTIALTTALSLMTPLMATAADEMKLINDGEVRFLTNPIYPPMEFIDPKTGVITGFDVDLGTAIAEKMGKEALWVTTSFAQLQSSLATGRGDVIISGMSDNPKRQESMDFVDYVKSGPVFIVAEGQSSSFKSNADVCGKKVAGSRSSSFGADVVKWSSEYCEAKGLGAITFNGVQDSNAARLGLKQGRYDVVVQGIETIAYQIQSEPGVYHIVDKPILDTDVFGIGVKKDNPALRDAIADSLSELIENGTYAELLKKWGLVHNAVKTVQINGVK
ncbi:ABC transporter substrate-binding protein [Marinomonas sp. C2222]|uniref:ABC transporter substrate-binding protein n=1 Tax=Marinomonas sargassi TaxID=2984494 RepID=A0ABT2YUJ6_9GAMM|nr:ABC transporter substrate-binding protein [Marinomonas sargassi]MCV2403577.1 ABC transporter substrate-binding protein [Marinomonas sargassi]